MTIRAEASLPEALYRKACAITFSMFWLSTGSILVTTPLHGATWTSGEPAILDAKKARIGLRLGEKLYPDVLELPPTEPTTVVNFPAPDNGTHRLCLEADDRTACAMVPAGGKKAFRVRFADRVYVFELRSRAPGAHFTAAYKQRYRGTLRVENPEVYELVNIALALTDHARRQKGLVRSGTAYAQQVVAHFAQFRQDPFVTALDRRMKDDPASYHLLKMNGAAFRFDGNARIIPDPNYSRIGWGANELAPLLSNMQDFASRSRFRTFYEQHLPLYRAQAADINTGFGAGRMAKWLAAQFPGTPTYDSIRVLFSPLVGSNQSSAKLEDRGFRELQAHINYPDGKQDDLKISDRGLALQRGAILFTELNHGFIDEPSALHVGRIAEALNEREAWVKAGPTGDAYGDPKSLFDEMMNWALISLYAVDNVAPQDVEPIMAWTEDVMQRRRGFIRFRPFNRRLVQLYRERPAGATVASLYDALVVSLPAIASEPSYSSATSRIQESTPNRRRIGSTPPIVPLSKRIDKVGFPPAADFAALHFSGQLRR